MRVDRISEKTYEILYPVTDRKDWNLNLEKKETCFCYINTFYLLYSLCLQCKWRSLTVKCSLQKKKRVDVVSFLSKMINENLLRRESADSLMRICIRSHYEIVSKSQREAGFGERSQKWCAAV